ncbi:glycoside hydrolase family 30 protein [Terriglobus albidus]|uniref:hypothetical protein n=1 Tax=Terriglobus albidus TaxID=1592106 RepID=UPI0021E0E642|nr:hypothetical protein [Terriglobus albidus]
MNSMHRALLVLTAVAGLLSGTRGVAQTTIHLDATSSGKVFEGLGAVSAGASSRLLIDYPEPQRSEILDFLFKPKFGASLQHLKVEIGSDVNSTDGSEPSHMRSANDHDYSRGYEWWLMKEARKRNPAIVLDTLAWGAPGWVGHGKFFSKDMAEYVADFLEGAQKQGLNIEYTGAWNERRPDYEWVKLLRTVLDQHGLKTKIVCCDMTPNSGMYTVLDKVNADPALDKAVDVIGVHYPAEVPGIAPAAIQDTQRRVWSSEDQPNPGSGPFIARDWAHGGRILARRYNENYIKAHFTKTEIWSPITSYYDLLAAPNSGLMYANTPWSGNYEVQSTIWVTAHTTQFVEPGWKYMDSATGYLPDDSGTYVAMHAPLSGSKPADWSIILETTSANRVQHVTLQLSKGLSNGTAFVWQTNATKTFEQVAATPVKDGRVTYDFEPGSIYTVTTTTGQTRGTSHPPAAAAFPFPYSDDFEAVEIGRTAKYLSDQDGAFEAIACEGRAGRCVQQKITERPTPWSPRPDPFTMAGDVKWTDYKIGIDVMLPKDGIATVQGRIDSADVFQDHNALYPSGYVLKVAANGNWSLLSTRFKNSPAALAQGHTDLKQGWHRMELQFQGASITAFLDGKQLSLVQDTAHSAGMAGFGSDWSNVQFDNLRISK